MMYKLEQIEGISPFFADELGKVDIKSFEDLLIRLATDDGRRDVATKTGLPLNQLTAWFHRADLMRINGIGSEFGQLLEASGVPSVEALASKDPSNLENLLTRVNAANRLTRNTPSMRTIAKWIAEAKTLVHAPVAHADHAQIAAVGA